MNGATGPLDMKAKRARPNNRTAHRRSLGILPLSVVAGLAGVRTQPMGRVSPLSNAKPSRKRSLGELRALLALLALSDDDLARLCLAIPDETQAGGVIFSAVLLERRKRGHSTL